MQSLRNFCNLINVTSAADMANKRIKARTLLHLKDASYSLRIKGISTKTINSLSRQSYQLTLCEQISRLLINISDIF